MRVPVIDGVLEIDDNGEQDLLIVFAQRDAKHFAFQTVSQGLPCAKLFVRDPSSRGWYNNGLPGLGDSIPEIVDALRPFVSRTRYKRIGALGSSMGAYAAILFGALLEVDRVLAFNPQTTLNRVFPLSPPEGFPVQCADLALVVSEARQTRFDIAVGDDDIVDLCHAAHLVGLADLQVWTVPGSSHLLPDELNRAGELAFLLQQWFDAGRMEILQAVPIASSRSKAAELERGVLAFMSGDCRSALPALHACLQEQPSHPGLALFTGIAAADQTETGTAIEALRITLRYRPHWEHAQEHLRSCLAKRGPLNVSAQPDAVATLQVFEGVGSSFDAAAYDAIAVARSKGVSVYVLEAEVVGWGLNVIGIGGACQYWARIRIKAETAASGESGSMSSTDAAGLESGYISHEQTLIANG